MKKPLSGKTVERLFHLGHIWLETTKPRRDKGIRKYLG